MKTRGLGRGLDALMPVLPQEGAEGRIVALPLGDIDPNREQPRKHFDEQALAQLADSIRQAGVIQPIIVYELDGRYQIVSGERRWRAARLAGLEIIPAIVRDYDAIARMEVALIENLQREDLSPIEEAAGIRALMDECGLTQESVAQRLGRSRPAVANLLRLLTLPAQIQQWVTEGKLSAGHARVLAGVESRTRQLTLAQTAMEAGWSVRQLEQEAAKPERDREKPARRVVPELDALEGRLRETLGLRAAVSGNLKRGKIVLQYYSAQELEQFYTLLEEMQNGDR